ncbi:MAG: hypothetical protein QM779_09610 [Propionicimonas sp.]
MTRDLHDNAATSSTEMPASAGMTHTGDRTVHDKVDASSRLRHRSVHVVVDGVGGTPALPP